MPSKYSPYEEQSILNDILAPEIRNDPRAFVRLVYPWDTPGTPLEGIKGPRNWQDNELLQIARYLQEAQAYRLVHGTCPKFYKRGIASGRGIGKSAFFGQIAHWLLSTRVGGSVWVTANGEPQLRTKTFPEISKWVSLGINSHWFDINAMSIVPQKWIANIVENELKIDSGYWYVQGQLWKEEAPDAFAGAHNSYGECYLFDEASGIPRGIWTVAQGVFTEDIVDRFWLAFSNPRRNDGEFRDLFKPDSEWSTINIDARTVEGLNQSTYDEIINKFGKDSDEARIEVYGQFPNHAEDQFIGMGMVEDAMNRVVLEDMGEPLIMGVDPSRGNLDDNCIVYRRGRNWNIHPIERFRQINTTLTVDRIVELYHKHEVDYVFIDAGGIGGPIYDILKFTYKINVIDVNFGNTADEPERYANRRSEIWARAKAHLEIAQIPKDLRLKTDLTTPKYRYDDVSNQLILESKKDMRNRGAQSPDSADAYAVTFAKRVLPRLDKSQHRRHKKGIVMDTDYHML